MTKKIFFSILVLAILFLGFASRALAVPLAPNSSLFGGSDTISPGAGPANAPDAYQIPQSRQAQNQVPEKLQFVFQGHAWGMQNLGKHFVSDVQSLLQDIEDVNGSAWSNLVGAYRNELLKYSSISTPAALASVPAGGLAVAALDNVGGIARQNLQFGIPFLFEGLGLQFGGSDCNSSIKGMLQGNCRWGTPPKIESAIFSDIIGQDVNLNQLGGSYEVWGVAPARATLINLIFNKGLFR